MEQAVQDLDIQDLQSPSSPSSPTSGQQQQQRSYFAVREGLQGIKRIIGTRLALGKEILVTRSNSTTSVTSVTITAATDESEAVVGAAVGTTTKVVREHVHFEEEVLSDVEEVLSDADADGSTDLDGEGVVSPPSSPQLSPTLEGGEKEKKKVYPGTINARFVKRQSAKQSVRGLEHALKASIAKTGPEQESGRLCKCFCLFLVLFCLVGRSGTHCLEDRLFVLAALFFMKRGEEEEWRKCEGGSPTTKKKCDAKLGVALHT